MVLKDLGTADWWRQAVVYQIYPRSFSDSDGDGIGDLPGITSRVPYLRDLGVDAVWLSPFYPSELADGGYDVADYRNVDPRLGTLDDFDAMSAALHAAGIKLIVDIVPNHTSDQHEWFQAALAAGRGSDERDRYHFFEGKGENGDEPPNDWQSHFGGPAWHRVDEPDGTPGQWYLHMFAREQPDLNWERDDVRADFEHTLRFWSDRGVDGFRIDVAHYLRKDLSEPFAPFAVVGLGELTLNPDHPFSDRDEVHEIYRAWRKVFDEYTPPRTAVAEAWVHKTRLAPYASAEGLGQAFNFDLLVSEFEASQFREIIEENLERSAETGSSSTWVLSNHDVTRHATRYGLPAGLGHHAAAWTLAGGAHDEVDTAVGEARARAATMLLLALPGSTYLYQGEELGLHEVGDIPAQSRQDPTFFRTEGKEVGRDGCRVPLPWSGTGSSFGFGSDGAHLPQPAWFADYAVAVEADDAASTLNLYRRALALRGELQTAETLTWIEHPSASVLAFERPGGWRSFTNFGSEPVDLPEGEILLASTDSADGRLPGNATVWMR
ncbi:glycoside hydrolase family 13 protein [Tsukamurella pseudospumae]|uniref:Alpha-amylase n=1 Tax=Tsukamurella pseudospumae TaxID=239498 RepID=A0A138A0W2_9ACTN|nr:alpha-amylase family glycosyl hydrolase [Tsukamurella pseudospumae]KXO88858.1 alpha-amylase [Tsukamurella pseudospumae]KXP04059.1 alpha-amylase [Tsukamurella pseudospumae]